MATRVYRSLSAFNRCTRQWAPIICHSNPQSEAIQSLSVTSQNVNNFLKQRLSLISWNIDAFSSRPVARAKRILGHILEGSTSSDIIFFQEVTSEVRSSLLNDPRVRTSFLASDAEDQTSFEDVPFATMTLLSRARFNWDTEWQKEAGAIEGVEKFSIKGVSRMKLPSKYRRDALSLDSVSPTGSSMVFRLINVHLDSLSDTRPYRVQQIEILANVLREPECCAGLIAGDFNAISPGDGGLIEINGLSDAWVVLHGKAEEASGATLYGVGTKAEYRFGPGRLDKVAMMGLNVERMEILRPGLIEVPKPREDSVRISWSDHCGLRSTYVVIGPYPTSI